jgi:DNA polymerase bacteriophage-type
MSGTSPLAALGRLQDRGVLLVPNNTGVEWCAEREPTNAEAGYIATHAADLAIALRRAYLDFETISLLPLPAAGAQAYAVHPSTRVLVLCWAVGMGEVHALNWTGPWDTSCPDELRQAIEAGYTVIAHSHGFEAAIWQAHMVPAGWPPIAETQWSCTAARARAARYPAKLERLTRRLELRHQKDKIGAMLIAKANRLMQRGARLSDQDMQSFIGYCRADTEALRELDRTLHELRDQERAAWLLDARMNTRGLPIDLDSAGHLDVIRRAEDDRLTARMQELVGLSPTQAQKLLAWLKSAGANLLNLKQETLEGWLSARAKDRATAAGVVTDNRVEQVVRCRLEHASSAATKLQRMLLAALPVPRSLGTASLDHRVCGCFQWHQAHTGRWAGRIIQPQNLPRIPKDFDPERELTALINDWPGAGSAATMSIKARLACVLRALIQAPDGYRLVVCDFAQVEARVLAWLAGERTMLDLYRRKADPYIATARALGSENRQFGKLLVLSAGFGAGGGKLHQVAPRYGLVLKLPDAERAIQRWRAANPKIVAFWYDLQEMLKSAVDGPTGTIWRYPRGGPYKLAARKARDDTLRVTLLSERELIYHQPRMVEREDWPGMFDLVYQQVKGFDWREQRGWHGLATENVVQATAYDLMADAMLRMEANGIEIIGTVHDEVIALASATTADAMLADMQSIMVTPPSWASDLPLAAEGYVNQRYVKPVKEHTPSRIQRS